MKSLIKKLVNQLGYQVSKIDESVLKVGSSERPVGRMDFLLEDLKHRGLKCNSILDVGANRTKWSRMAKGIYPEASIHLIEPQVEMKQYLDSFCAEYQDCSYTMAGAGAKKDVLTLTVWDDLAGSSFLPVQDEKLLTEGKQRKIEIITIDELIDKNIISVPQLVKLDIQGFELEALKGGARTFGTTEVYILEASLFPSDGEDMPVFTQVVDFMLKRGYVVYDFPGFLRRPNDGALAQCDICFVKENGFLRKSNSWL